VREKTSVASRQGRKRRRVLKAIEFTGPKVGAGDMEAGVHDWPLTLLKRAAKEQNPKNLGEDLFGETRRGST